VAIVEEEGTVHSIRQLGIVRGDKRGQPFRVNKIDEFGEDAAGGFRIEIAGRLVGQE
jgi:hypothetical protein